MSSHRPFEQPLSLLEMPCGCPLCVEELVGSPSLRSRLYSMGIIPGTEMELCRGGRGSVCVRVKQSSLVLGEGMAEAIYCRRSEGHGMHRRHHHHHHHHHCHHHPHGYADALSGGEAKTCGCDVAMNQPRTVQDGAAAVEAKKDDNV